MTNQQGEPEALRVEAAYGDDGKFIGYRLLSSGANGGLLVWADQKAMPGFRIGDHFVPGYREVIDYKPVALVEAQQPATHVQNPAEIEHVAGDVSKNDAEVNMSTWQEEQVPCPTCAALARTVMLDQVSFDRKPDCYGIRQITDDEGVEEWEDIRTSPDVAREEANDMMATGRGEIYEVVPLWTTPQPSPTPQADSQPAPVRDYPPLTISEARDLTCMLAGAPWPDEMLPELLQLLTIYDNLRFDNARPVDPASLPPDMAQAVIATGRNPAATEQTAEPTGFGEWVRQAYRAPESTSFTVHNMAVAYRAGRDADRAASAPADSVTAAGGETYHLGACIVEDMLHATVMRKEPGRAGAVTVLLSEQIPVKHLQDRDVIVDATPPAQAADSVLEDAARYRWLRDQNNPLENYDYVRRELNGTSCYHMVGGVRELKSGPELDSATDAARKQGANHD